MYTKQQYIYIYIYICISYHIISYQLSEEDISIEDIADSDIGNQDATEEGSQVFAASMILRKELLSPRNRMPFSPDTSNVSEHEINLSVCVYNSLCRTICGDQPCKNLNLNEQVNGVSTAIRRRILSIGQDLVYSTSRGRVKTTKHVALPLTFN